ncbi:MAG: hypothetical protein IJB79_03525 [Candidatus Gastranaerophilales bacterium]|nr:hypothetical protein [Candidatus Gastranaerophilales bacterium]
MAISKAQIFNIALNILGVSTPLENPNSTDNRAILLNNYYELARDYVLKDFDWNFASTFKELSLSQIALENTGYEYCYDYPNDCICARDIFQKGSFVQQKFSISSLADGSIVILTNTQGAILRYTKRVEKEIFFSCEFSMALAHYLASLTAGVIVGSVQKGESAWEKYNKILSHAKVLNAYESGENIYDDNTYLNARS